jgi:hypothetical protein
MVDGQVAQDLAEVVMDHLGRGPQTDLAVGTIANGLSRISSALHDIQERDGNWSHILRKLRTGVDEVQISIEALRADGGAGVTGLLSFAERQLLFAELLEEEVQRRLRRTAARA